jgi:hypothetical protein
MQNKESLTKGEWIILKSHPIIRDLLSYSRKANCTTGSFYIPIDDLIKTVFSDIPHQEKRVQGAEVEVLYSHTSPRTNQD